MFALIALYIRFMPTSRAASVVRWLVSESRVLWVRVPPEAADFSLKKSSSGVLELCVLCIFGTVIKESVDSLC